MTAADRREELEAAIHRQLTRAWKYGLQPSGRDKPADLILAAHDACVQAAVDEAVGAMRLQLARAEHSPATDAAAATRDEAGRFSSTGRPS